MQRISNAVRNFVREDEGATAVEYGLLVALIAAIIVVAVKNIGQTVDKAFKDTDTAIKTP